MAITAQSKDELLSAALATDLPVVPGVEPVSLKAPEPVAAPVDFSAAKADKPLPVKESYMAAVKPDMDALEKAEEEKLKFAALEKIDLADREAAKQFKLGESASQQKREILDDPARAQYKKALEDKAKPFIPYEENAQDMMALFGLLNVVGFAIGSGGKEYSQAAMSAMNGMLEGHRKGREDLYKKEKSIFETNQRQLDSRIKQLLAFMQDNQLLTNMDKTARDQAIQSEFLQMGANFLSEYYKKNGYGKTVETLKEMVRASGKAAELVAKEEARAAEQDFTLRLESQRAREARERERDKVLAQYDLASQTLTAQAKLAASNNNFALEKEISRRAFDLAKAKADWTHGENLSEINRKHAADIELARIKRDEVRDKDTAEYRLREKDYQDKRLGFEKDRLAETERHNREKEKIDREAAKNRAAGSGTSTSSGKGGAVQFRYNQAMTNAGNQLANEIENAASLPISATPPVLAEVLTDPTKGLSDAGKRFFSQKITDEEARAFQQVFAGMTRAITTIEASGRPSGATEGAIREFAKSQPRAGDKKINIYLSLAQSKQVMDILVKDLKAAEANSTQIAQAEEAKKRVDSFITWTVRDVNRIISSGARTLVDPKVQSALGTSQNLNEFNKQVGSRVSKDYATEADAEKAFKAGTLKSGDKVNIGGVSGTWE